MCEYSPECDNVDDPEAVAFWAASSTQLQQVGARLIWLVLCPPKKHPLAKVVLDPRSVERLVTPPMRFRQGSMYFEPNDPDATSHFHASALPLAEYDESAEIERGRCRCGTWHYVPATIKSQVFGHHHGVPYTLGGYVQMADQELPGERRAPDAPGRADVM